MPGKNKRDSDEEALMDEHKEMGTPLIGENNKSGELESSLEMVKMKKFEELSTETESANSQR